MAKFNKAQLQLFLHQPNRLTLLRLKNLANVTHQKNLGELGLKFKSASL